MHLYTHLFCRHAYIYIDIQMLTCIHFHVHMRVHAQGLRAWDHMSPAQDGTKDVHGKARWGVASAMVTGWGSPAMLGGVQTWSNNRASLKSESGCVATFEFDKLGADEQLFPKQVLEDSANNIYNQVA